MNPLLEDFNTPFQTIPFEKIKPEHYLPALKKSIELAKASVQSIIQSSDTPNFENTILTLENVSEKVDLVAGLLSNLNSCETNPELQEVARQVFPLIADYSNDIVLNEDLFKKIAYVFEHKSDFDLNPEQQMLLKKTYKSFSRNGAQLQEKEKNRLREIDRTLSQITLQFGENVLNETNGYELVITNPDDLNGIPETIIETALEEAKLRNKKNSWVFTLAYPSYIPFITYCENRSLRKEIFMAFGSKGCGRNKNDNQDIIIEIAKLRYERAQLLGYKSHADFVLEERMAQSPDTVYQFLNEILGHAKSVATEEIEELKKFARSINGPEKLERWDFAFYAQKLKKKKYEIDDELLRPYFKLEDVIQGVFDVAKKLYDISFEEVKNIPKYHSEVITYEVKNNNGDHVGVLYGDFFPRKGKRAGAWMTSYREQKIVSGKDVRPHISVVCNFTKPTQTKPSLLTFSEVLTMFHEFGHALHGLLSKCHYRSLSGTNVYWDFVELPSQIMENWVYEKPCLDLFAKHYQTGEKIPENYLKKIKESSKFNSGYQNVRQIGLARVDMAWHSTNPNGITNVFEFEENALKETEVLPKVDHTSISCSFSHIFQGGYAAGYYSYKWAEVLDADAFEEFKRNGLFDKETAKRFKNTVLSSGGKLHPMDLYVQFKGKKPSPQALLKRSGLIKTGEEN